MNSSGKRSQIRLRRMELEESIKELNSELAAYEDEAKYNRERIAIEREKLIIETSLDNMKNELSEILMVKSELQKKLQDTLSREKDLNQELTSYQERLDNNQRAEKNLEDILQKGKLLRYKLRERQELLTKIIAEERAYPKEQTDSIKSKQFTGAKKGYSLLEELISKGESSTLEFKSSLLTPTRPIPEVVALKQSLSQIADPARKRDQVERIKNIENKIKNELETEVIKTIAAFMNTKGGTLLIGVNDDGTISGIESDYSVFVNGKGYDTWQQHLKNLIRDRLGLENITYIQAEEFHVENKTVSWIKVQKASAPVFMDYLQKGQPRTDFFFRALNTTEVLNPRHQIDYINSNWPSNS